MKHGYLSELEQKDAPLLVRDEPCEEAVLAALLSDRNAFADFPQLSSESFYSPIHAEIYQAIAEVVNEGDKADVVSVFSRLSAKGSGVGPAQLALISSKHDRHEISRQVARLKDLEARRRIWRIGQELTQGGISEQDEIESLLESGKSGLNEVFSEAKQSITTFKDSLARLFDTINTNATKTETITGTRTGFDMIDNKGGLQPSDLVIIAGETSQGKTSFANSITLSAISSGKKVAFYSLEMTDIQLSARLLSIASKVPSNQLLYSALNGSQISQMDKGLGRLMPFSENLFFDDRSTSNIDTIIASIRTMKLKYNIDGAVVDYLQVLNVNSKSTNREQAMGDTARRFKNLAKELGIWIIALSQLSRDAVNPVPSINRLRDSGQIAEAADIVILVYRPEIYGRTFPQPFEKYDPKGRAMIDICKGRNIGTGKFVCGFEASTTYFYPLNDLELKGERSSFVPMPF